MDTNKLKEYLKTVLALEKQKYETKQLIENVQGNHYEATYKKIEEEKKSSGDNASFVGGFGGVLGFIIGFVLVGVADSLLYLLIGPIVGYIIGMCIGSSIDEKEAEKENTIIRSENKKTENDNRVLKMEVQMKNELIKNSVTQLQNSYQETDSVLQKIYSENIIYPKYRNLIAVSSLFEYIDSGRCSSLEGADGAYNIYENEVRLDRIITNLDTVITQLNRIMANQYYLYSAIQEIKPVIENMSNSIKENTEKLDAIHAETAKTAVNTEVTAYIAKVIERNQYYERNWNNMRGLNDHYSM